MADTDANYAELFGRIVKIIQRGIKGKDAIFVVHAQTLKRDFTCVCSFFAPIDEGDAVYAICTIEENTRYGQVLKFVRPPFIQVSMDKDSVLRCFIRVLRGTGFGNIKAHHLYDLFSRQAGGDNKVVSFISELAGIWNDNKDDDVFLPYTEVVTKDQMKKLITWWFKNRSLRRLYLFGLTNREIEACKMSHDKIYEYCLTNPYRLIPLSIDKCDEILLRQNKVGSPEDRRCAQIVRKMYAHMEDKSWTGTPSRILQTMFPDLVTYLDRLKKEYGVIGDLHTVYLDYAHRVEVAVSEKVDQLVRLNAIDPSTPMDSKLRESVNFKSTTLTDEQKIAVQGAIDNNISIITGSAGTGKCLSPDTPVLLYNGAIKTAKEIAIGDVLMGEDSTPRHVLSICSGFDNMYEIIPSKGRPFVCNEPHVLTLKGIMPHKEFHNVRYSEKGIIRNKAFATDEEASAFMASLPEDIFDIPLNVYMGMSDNFKRYTYLYHTGVDFPEQPVEFDPYLIGLWLGDGTTIRSETTNTDIDYMNQKLPEYGLDLSVRSNDVLYRIVSAGDNYRKKGGNEFINALKKYDLLSNKHIPDVYKINSRQIRLALLAGIIDSDGSQEHNCIEISPKSDQLADDIEYLAFSLGFMVTKHKTNKSCMYKGEKREGLYNLIRIFGEGLEEIPVLLDRKERLQKKRANCVSFKVKPLGRGIYFGFTLDGNGRFLLGDFLVTHNTTIIAEIVHNLTLRDEKFAIASFTGKAVARIREVIKLRSPSTLHRMIARAATIPKFAHLIIDEASMVTTELFYAFIKAFPGPYRITLVGDPNQLQPIGWGTLLEQLLKSKRVPIFRLSQNHRLEKVNGDINGIMANANGLIRAWGGDINEDEPPFEFVTTDNFSMIDGNIEIVYDVLRALYNSGVPANEITMITPYNKEIDDLNKTAQQIFNETSKSIVDSRGKLWCIRDRVMLLENNYEINVMNAEEGMVTDISPEEIAVQFKDGATHYFKLEPSPEDEKKDDEDHPYAKELTVLMLGHCFSISIHRAQGSEWPYVIIAVPAHTANSSFLNRNLIYTAITRAKRACWIVGDIEAFKAGAFRSAGYRCENLSERLSKVDISAVDLRTTDSSAPLVSQLEQLTI